MVRIGFERDIWRSLLRPPRPFPVRPQHKFVPLTVSIRRSFNILFALVGSLVVAGWFGLYDISTESGVFSLALMRLPYFGPLLTVLLWVWLFFVVITVVTRILFAVLEALPNVGSRLAAYVVVSALALFPNLKLGSDEPLPTAAEVPAAAPAPSPAEVLADERAAAEAKRVADTEAAAAEHDRASRAALVAEVDRLSAAVGAKWRADLEAAEAFGGEGEVPPMLRVEQQGEDVLVTNIAARPVCVSVARVARDSSGAVGARCALGLSDCQQIAAGSTHRFVTFRRSSRPACSQSPLEFRVGNWANPEPSWWSRSALEDLDARRVVDRHDHGAMPTLILSAERAEIEPLMQESDRAQRWQRELDESRK